MFFISVVGWAVAANASEREDTALWLARSCIGEAGWKAVETGECAAIWWVHRKRAGGQAGELEMTLRYSNAVKYSTRQWVVELNRDGEKPAGWPVGARWKYHLKYWKSTLLLADNFVAGDVPDPLPSAEHYGGEMDTGLSRWMWRRIPTDESFENRFYARRTSR
jgi:hypothetical protein